MHTALIAAAQHIPSTLARGEPRFPPPAVSGGSPSKRAGFDKAKRLDTPNATLAARGVKLLAEHSPRDLASDAANRDRDHGTDATLPAAAESAPGHAAVSGQTALRRWSLFAVASVGLVVTAVAATLAWTGRPVDQDNDSGFIVVQAAAPAAHMQIPASASSPSPTEPDDQAKRAAQPELPTKRTAQLKVKKPAPAGTVDPMQLMASEVARAFARQKAKVISCLDAHPEDMQNAPQLTVRVTVTATGHVGEAQLLPETIADKPVSGCVTRAVLSMSFPPQAEPTTFRVPLLWRRK
jgi:hypothetical protein